MILDPKTDPFQVLALAIRSEIEAANVYSKLHDQVKNESRRILEYLSRVERGHYFMIKSEIDLLEKYPEYYDVEDFHLGQDLFHVGP